MGLEYHPVTPERLADLGRFSEWHGKFHLGSPAIFQGAGFRGLTPLGQVRRIARYTMSASLESQQREEYR
jgi:hypothetical protein